MIFSLLDGIAALTIFISLFFSVFLLIHQDGNRNSHRFLSLFLFILCLENCNFLIFSLPVALEYPALANIGNNFGILFATVLYFYCRTLTEQTFRLHKIDACHLLPLFVVISYNVMFYHRLDTQSQLDILQGGASAWATYQLPLVIFGQSIIFCYLLAALLVLRKNGVKLRQFLSNIEAYELSWLRSVLAVFLLVWLIRICLIPLQFVDNANAVVNFFTYLLEILILLSVIVLMFNALRQHPIFMQIQTPTTALQPTADNDIEQREIDAAKLLSVVKRHQLWRQPSLTLSELATHLSLPAKVVSGILNDDLDKNFFEFINELRCDDAAMQITSTPTSILDIGYQCGFNSKTAFNRAFKKHLEITPSHYRKKHHSDV